MRIIKIIAGFVLMFNVFSLQAEQYNLTDDGLALMGFDALSFFESKPVKGREDLSYQHNGATFLFSSEAHLLAFKAQPQKYEPQYGGFCAYGVSLGKKLAIDPMAFEIVNEKLYLLLNAATQRIWAKDLLKNIDVANKNWFKSQ